MWQDSGSPSLSAMKRHTTTKVISGVLHLLLSVKGKSLREKTS